MIPGYEEELLELLRKKYLNKKKWALRTHTEPAILNGLARTSNNQSGDKSGMKAEPTHQRFPYSIIGRIALLSSWIPNPTFNIRTFIEQEMSF